MSPIPPTDPLQPSPAASFFAGWCAAWSSVFSLVLIGAYVGIGALAHGYGFSLLWVLLSTLLVWAGPAQVILLSALGADATPSEAALAVGLSGVRLPPWWSACVMWMPLLGWPLHRGRDALLGLLVP